MRLLILTPRQPRATGNHVTAERMRLGLEERGWAVRVMEVPVEMEELESAAGLFRPDRLLLLHAYRSGEIWLRAGSLHSVPAAVLLTGTDIHGGIDSRGEGPVIREVLQRSGAVLTQNPLTFAALRESGFPWHDRLRLVPPGIRLGTRPYPLRQLLGIDDRTILFLHPAGIRPVKGNLELLQLFDPLAASDRNFKVVFCGPCLDPEYGERFHSALGSRSWATYVGTIPSKAMAAALGEADIVLNHSSSEGLPNALLEAAVLGRPILARNIHGNAAVVEHGVNGLLYRSGEEFTSLAGQLVRGPEFRRSLSSPTPHQFRPEAEAGILEEVLVSLPESFRE